MLLLLFYVKSFFVFLSLPPPDSLLFVLGINRMKRSTTKRSTREHLQKCFDGDSRSSFVRSFDSDTHTRIDRADSSASEARMQMGDVFRFICQIKLKIRSCFFIFVEFDLARLSFVVSWDDKLISTSERERERERNQRENYQTSDRRLSFVSAN